MVKGKGASGAICVDRGSEEGIREAVADLLSLSRCNYIHGYTFLKVPTRFPVVARNIFI